MNRRRLLWLALAAAILLAPGAAVPAEPPGIFRIVPLRPVDELRREALAASAPQEKGPFRPVDLVDLASLDPTIRLDVRYATADNFLGTPVYEQARAFLQRPAAQALLRAHRALRARGYGLLIHDAYRPWWVTKVFWEATPVDKREFVADPAKGSRHNRGCAVDLTLYTLADGRPVVMPSLYDEMTGRASPRYTGGSDEQRARRELLRGAMEAEGFAVFESEWWHFDYRSWREYPILNLRFDQIGEGLAALLAEAWEQDLQEDPLLATATGDHRFDDRLPSLTEGDLERRAAGARARLERLRGIDRASLAPGDRVSYDMFERQEQDALAEHAFRAWRIPITSDSGFHTEIARLWQEVPLASVRDYDNYVARLHAIPTYFDQHVALMREGLRTGFTMPHVVLEGYDATVRAQVVDVAEHSVFWKPFEAFPVGVPAAERERLRAAGREAITSAVLPAYRSLLEFFTREYVPGARQSVGASDLPQGRAYYEWLVRRFTTLDTTPEAVHELGLAETGRIHAEMQAIVAKLGFQGSFQAFLEFLRSDPRFYAKTPDELLQRAAWIAKRMDGRLPSLFGRLPRQPYGVEPVPPDLAPRYTGGRYVGAPLDGTRAGTYWVNTHALESRPLYTLEALTLHEAVPGHHLQIALAKELDGLPAFRRNAYVDAFGEGWGLYCERLGLEAGFYTDPYSDFGRLTYEMWRACRLVVDTGLHAKGWTRQQAIDFMAERTALSRHEITTEVDRYISWPGQALAYKMGELKIRELRARAERALGPRFDLRAFHDAVLANGSVPLTILERQIDAFVAAGGR